MAKTDLWAPEILQRVHRLTEPKSYWMGRPGTPPLQPRNILLFRRHRIRDLARPHGWQHHRYVLVTVLEGKGKAGIDSEVYSLAAGQSLLIFPFQSHVFFEIDTALNWLFVTFEHPVDERLELLRNRGGIALDAAAQEGMSGTLRAWSSRHGPSELPLHLGIWLHRMLKKKSGKPSGNFPAKSATIGLVDRVNRLAFEERYRLVTLEDMASRLGVSQSQLRSRFREATGKSLGHHIREIRHNYACELLYNTQLRIGEIAQRCGYDTVFSFSRAFRTFSGCSPSEYRARSQSTGVS